MQSYMSKWLEKQMGKETSFEGTLHEKRVMLNCKKILKDPSKLQKDFIKFVGDNRNTVFIATLDYERPQTTDLYTLKMTDGEKMSKQAELWYFHEENLIPVKER